LARRLLAKCWRGDRCPRFSILAGEQTEGRGRQGRSWVSSADLGVYATIVRPVGGRDSVQTLPQLIGVGLAKTLRSEFGCEVGLKWPNDLLVGGRKLGGVLIETVTRDDDDVAAIIGFGVNHGHDAAGLPTPVSTSLRLELDDLPPLEAVARALVAGVLEELRHTGDLDYAGRSYEQLTIHRSGDRLRCRVGERALEGSFIGFDRYGHLRLEVGGSECVFNSGEIVE